MSNRALILLDIQNDFLPGGALSVSNGDQVIPVVNQLVKTFDLVVATQDWHPPNHCSFAASHPGREIGEVIEVDGLHQELWPVHCVAETYGAELASALHLPVDLYRVRKGTNPRVDSYSAFFDNGHRYQTELESRLRAAHVEILYLAGLTTDYCIKFSALDAASLGFTTYVVVDACRPVNLHPGDEERALQEMKRAGVCLIQSNDCI